MTGQTPQDRREQIVGLAKGDRGERGEQGEQGARGEQMSPRLRRSLVYLFGAAAALAILAFLISVHSQSASRAAQQRQGEMVEAKLCTTLGRLAELRPPPGNPQSNPSRAYLQHLHETLSQLAPDLGCR